MQKDKEEAGRIRKIDSEVRSAYAKKTYSTCNMTKGEAVEAMKFKISEELIIHRKMKALAFTITD